jgi:hypothetical protein
MLAAITDGRTIKDLPKKRLNRAQKTHIQYSILLFFDEHFPERELREAQSPLDLVHNEKHDSDVTDAPHACQ